jgi:hypothetical protein
MLPRLLMIAILVACGGSVHGQSLSEVAAKEKERRVKSGGSGKSYTDSDLRDAADKRAKEGGSSSSDIRPPSIVQATSDANPWPPVAEDSTSSTDSSQSDATRKARGADYKARLAALNAQLRDAEEYLSAAEKDWHMVNMHPWQLAASYEKVRARLEAAKKTVQRIRSLRDDMEDAARREGIPPGYLR